MAIDQDSSTRKVILTMLKTKGPLSVNEMAKQLGITEMAVRRHLNTLERDTLISSILVRQAMGRPSHNYSLTPLAQDMFPKNYHTLTLDLLEELDEQDGTDLVGKLFDSRKKKLIHKYKDRMDSDDLTKRVSALADIQNAGGYMVEWEEDASGNYVFQEYNCPISQVANKYNHACQCELSLFQTLLDTDVVRTECLANGGKKCVYLIKGKHDKP
ncbi:MAG TPA: metalloregulator ArsR/SmtB family transcription factor [Bacilli bacterium]